MKVKWPFSFLVGSVEMNGKSYSFGGVVDLMGLMFDYPEQNVKE